MRLETLDLMRAVHSTDKEARAVSVTVNDLRAWKASGKRFPMLTAYDYPTARILDRAGIPVLLVGDSLGQAVLGYETTLPVTMDEMIHHTKAVSRGAENALVVGDMPFMSYQASPEDAIRNAGRFLKEAGAHVVKIEGPLFELAGAMTERGIPVMAHLGLTPQSVNTMGGYRVQGRDEEAAAHMIEAAHLMEKSGVCAIVLEGIPADLGQRITEAVSVPTIGIGAGPGCDGQVLVITDLLGLTEGEPPKFAKAYVNLADEMARAVRTFAQEVEAGTFPDAAHSYH
jgi:3-methyl-2-oxobutanoate hydroxymethyltransferase